MKTINILFGVLTVASIGAVGIVGKGSIAKDKKIDKLQNEVREIEEGKKALEEQVVNLKSGVADFKKQNEDLQNKINTCLSDLDNARKNVKVVTKTVPVEKIVHVENPVNEELQKKVSELEEQVKCWETGGVWITSCRYEPDYYFDHL